MKATKLFASALLVMGYVSIYYALKGNSQQYLMSMICIGSAILIALHYHVKKKSEFGKKD